MTPGSITDQPERTDAEVGARFCVAIQFALEDDLRYLSHHDEIRMLVRALTRAAWPVAHSRGYNPQPRIVLPLPRAVGMSSTREWALVELTEARAATELHDTLAAALPSGCRVHGVVPLPKRMKPQPRQAVYTIELEPAHAALARTRITNLLAANHVTVERDYGPERPSRAIDIRPYIETVDLDQQTLRVRLAFVDQRTARPTEVLTAMHLPAGAYIHRVCRVEVKWNQELAPRVETPASTERTTVGREESSSAQAQTHDT